MEKLGKKIEVLANLAIVIVALTIVGVFASKFFLAIPDVSQQTAEVKIGESLNLRKLETTNQTTLIVAFMHIQLM